MIFSTSNNPIDENVISGGRVIDFSVMSPVIRYHVKEVPPLKLGGIHDKYGPSSSEATDNSMGEPGSRKVSRTNPYPQELLGFCP